MRMPRFTIGRLMVSVATLAIASGTLIGITAYNSYTFHASTEQRFREDAIIWVSKNELARAEESRRMAGYQAEMKRPYAANANFVPTLIVVGVVMGGVSLSIGGLQRAGLSGRAGGLESLRATCWIVAKVVAMGLFLAAIIYFLLFAVVFLFVDD